MSLNGMKQMQGEKRVEFIARCQAAQRAAAAAAPVRTIRRKARTRRPVHGSQEWAETRGDDLGASGDF